MHSCAMARHSYRTDKVGGLLNKISGDSFGVNGACWFFFLYFPFIGKADPTVTVVRVAGGSEGPCPIRLGGVPPPFTHSLLWSRRSTR